MTDIFHGEADVELEWSVVSLSFLPILAFHAVACGIGAGDCQAGQPPDSEKTDA